MIKIHRAKGECFKTGEIKYICLFTEEKEIMKSDKAMKKELRINLCNNTIEGMGVDGL